MGVSYFLQCESCWEQILELDEDDFESIDAYDEAWEKLDDELDPIFPLFWGGGQLNQASRVDRKT